ncbi:dTDP-glucose 4,6-dehydratase [Planktomarina temperata]|nr:dTDP-glucose 4,6-dehydratase [Planktomarina temperata]MDC1094180.1 dTDP-glucose 4,6-dehydratase [Planktomarina temperata]
MKKNKILVTGGAGFIGSNFIDKILNTTSFSVVNLDCIDSSSVLETVSRFEKYKHRFSHFTGSIDDERYVRQLLESFRPSWVINFAAKSHVDKSIASPKEFFETNVYGTFVLLEEIYRASLNGFLDRDTFQFIQISTDEVYGDAAKRGGSSFLEEDRLEPSSPYSATKACSEHLVNAWSKTFGLNTLITRTTNNYGPYQNPEKFIPKVINNIINTREIPVYGDGSQKRDWIYVADNVASIIGLMGKSKMAPTYNISSGQEVTNLHLIEKIISIMASKDLGYSVSDLRELVTFVSDRPGHDRHYSCDSTKLRDEIKTFDFCDLEAGLTKTVEWYLANQTWSESLYLKTDTNDHLRWRTQLIE